MDISIRRDKKMNLKDFAIGLFAGIFIGFCMSLGAAHSAPEPPQQITKHDLMEAAALTGILANSTHDPWGTLNLNFIRQPKDFRSLAKTYADALK